MLDLTQPFDAHIDRRLRTEPILWLGSAAPDGRPHLVPMWFLWDGATVLMFSLPNTRKLRNLRRNPAVALSLDTAQQGYDVVIVEGRAELPIDPHLSGTMPEFVAKYASIPRRWPPAEWAERFTVAIRVKPTRLTAWLTRPDAPPQWRTVVFSDA
jgi:PPOX class probable F420-dependent enzyme